MRIFTFSNLFSKISVGAFRRLGIFLCFMDSAERMLRRRVNRVKFNWHVSSVDKVVPRACRDKNGVIVAYSALEVKAVFAAAHSNEPVPLFKAQKLVYVRMHFQADISADANAHQCKLQVFTCPQGGPEVIILLCGSGNIYCVRTFAVIIQNYACAGRVTAAVPAAACAATIVTKHFNYPLLFRILHHHFMLDYSICAHVKKHIFPERLLLL